MYQVYRQTTDPREGSGICSSKGQNSPTQEVPPKETLDHGCRSVYRQTTDPREGSGICSSKGQNSPTQEVPPKETLDHGCRSQSEETVVCEQAGNCVGVESCGAEDESRDISYCSDNDRSIDSMTRHNRGEPTFVGFNSEVEFSVIVCDEEQTTYTFDPFAVMSPSDNDGSWAPAFPDGREDTFRSGTLEYAIDGSGDSHLMQGWTKPLLESDVPLYSNRALSAYYQSGRVVDQTTTSEFPSCFYCPITHDVMDDPVVLPDGYSFERREIEVWVEREATSPITRMQVSLPEIRPNKALAKLIQRHIEIRKEGSAGQGDCSRQSNRGRVSIAKLPRPRHSKENYAHYYAGFHSAGSKPGDLFVRKSQRVCEEKIRFVG